MEKDTRKAVRDTDSALEQAQDTDSTLEQPKDADSTLEQAQNADSAATEKHKETEEEYVILTFEPVSVEEIRGESEIQQRGRKRKRDPDNWKKNV